jgi:predicted SprT family Zn-dependent metalloprotease
VVGLERRLEVTFSGRFRRSLGRCVPAAGEIRLAAFLLAGTQAVLWEALCHEAAHAAVYELYGRGPAPHGEEWRALMRAAGFQPRVRVPASLLPDASVRWQRAESLWEHRCPICHASRVARRRVPQWRCAACRAAGLEGELITTRVAGGRL